MEERRSGGDRRARALEMVEDRRKGDRRTLSQRRAWDRRGDFERRRGEIQHIRIG
jgi:hypothetical protein